MIGHLGNRVSALLDGHLDEAEAERAWAHVHACHLCRDQVEREGWVKSRLSRLSTGEQEAPADLKGSLLGAACAGDRLPPELYLGHPPEPRRARRAAGYATVGGGAVGAAVMGVLALGAAPADAPGLDRRSPVSSVVPTLPSATTSPSGAAGGSGFVPTTTTRWTTRGDR